MSRIHFTFDIASALRQRFVMERLHANGPYFKQRWCKKEAARMGVSEKAIRDIVNWKTWKYVDRRHKARSDHDSFPVGNVSMDAMDNTWLTVDEWYDQQPPILGKPIELPRVTFAAALRP